MVMYWRPPRSNAVVDSACIQFGKKLLKGQHILQRTLRAYIAAIKENMNAGFPDTFLRGSPQHGPEMIDM
jgi:hypothetical protein